VSTKESAVASLYGGKALAGNVGVAARVQEVLTPPWVLDKARLKKAVKPYYLGGALAERWDLGPAFVNAPFEFLEQWMAKCAIEAAIGTPIVMLGPTRGHRAWFWKALRGAELVHLHSRFAFVGHTSSFPAPLFLASWGCKIPDLGARETHREQVT
jgi:hypothetical protein